MNNKFRILTISVLTSAFLVGCGGGGSSDTNTGMSENSSLIVDSFTNTLSKSLNKVYNTYNNTDYNYNLSTCRLGGLYDTNITIYANSSVEKSYTLSNNIYNGVYLIDSAYQKLELENNMINASYVNDNTFYDNSTKVYYDISPSLTVSGRELRSIVQNYK